MIPDYVKRLQKEIQSRAGSAEKISSIYFGGGTPSLLSVREVDTILQAIGENFSVTHDSEVTLEVNPGTVNAAFLGDLNRSGVNRLSIGVQSFNDDKLRFLKRIHTADQAETAVKAAGKAGFDKISMDLIYGVPFETQTRWGKDLDAAVKFSPSHLSCYMLSIEPGTPLDEQLKKGILSPIGSTDRSRLFEQTSLFLGERGYEHYEISSFSKGRQNRSRHNSKYWDMSPYLGFGASAHSYNGKTRSWNHRDIEAYIKDLDSGRLPVEGHETLTREQKILEMIMLRLRTLDGLDLGKFERRFHFSFEDRFKELLEHLYKESLGDIGHNRFALSLEGRMRLNSIVEAFAEKIS